MKRRKVLIADDRTQSRDGLKSLLDTVPEVEVAGEAADGQEVVRLAGECQPDLILIDVQMPVVDGLEATRLIKDRWPRVKIVVLTMCGAYRAAAMAAGADAFLLKGCTDQDLLAVILDE